MMNFYVRLYPRSISGFSSDLTTSATVIFIDLHQLTRASLSSGGIGISIEHRGLLSAGLPIIVKSFSNITEYDNLFLAQSS
jgi:hypothetical protein